MTIAQTHSSSQAVIHASQREALGNTANISATGTKQVKKQTVLTHSRKTLKEHKVISKRTGKPHRMIFCQAARAYGADAVTIKLNGDATRSEANFSGLQNCGCVWGCPVCAPRIAVEKGSFVLKSLKWAEQNGLTPVMVALTARHHAGMTLEEFKAKFKAAWTMYSKHRSWMNFKALFGITEWIANREVTHGDAGWHYHMHLLLFVDLKAADAADALDLQSEMETLWLHCLDACGLNGLQGIALKVSAHSNVGQQYLTKIGLSISETDGKLEYEMTGSANKDGRDVWDLLRHSYYGDETATRLYVEFVEAMSGDNFLTSSHGLKKLAQSVTLEEEAAGDESETVTDELKPWAIISPYWWSIIIRAYGSARILETAAISRDIETVRHVAWALQEELIDAGELPDYHRVFRHVPATSDDFAEGIRLIE